VTAEIPGRPSLGFSTRAPVVVWTLWAEYVWLQEQRPGATVTKRRELCEGERFFDILTVELPGQDAHEVFFDVTACFSDLAPTPPCPYCGERLMTAKARQCAQCFADFHDPAHVVFRKGRDYVDRVREMSAQRRELEARSVALNDPRAAFNAQFHPRRVTADIFVLSFPDRLSTLDDRVFRIGVEFLTADGCRGVVCHVDRPLRPLEQSMTTEALAHVGLLFARITQFARRGVRVVCVGGDALLKVPNSFIVLENHRTEELAIAGLTSRLRSK
jgi:hypothetical protein